MERPKFRWVFTLLSIVFFIIITFVFDIHIGFLIGAVLSTIIGNIYFYKKRVKKWQIGWENQMKKWEEDEKRDEEKNLKNINVTADLVKDKSSGGYVEDDVMTAPQPKSETTLKNKKFIFPEHAKDYFASRPNYIPLPIDVSKIIWPQEGSREDVILKKLCNNMYISELSKEDLAKDTDIVVKTVRKYIYKLRKKGWPIKTIVKNNDKSSDSKEGETVFYILES